MSLYTLVDWSVVVLAFGSVATGIGIGIGNVLAVMDRVARLEGFANEVTYELLAKEQAHDVQLMRERMDRIEYEMAELGDSSEKAVA